MVCDSSWTEHKPNPAYNVSGDEDFFFIREVYNISTFPLKYLEVTFDEIVFFSIAYEGLAVNMRGKTI
jgi:hypothetical protein